MLLAIKKFIVALLMPISGFFSFSAEEAAPLISVGPPAAAERSRSDPAGQPAARQDSTAPGGISAADLKHCLAAAKSGECLDPLFRKFLKTRSTAEALAIIKNYEAQDSALKLSCHPVVHAIGRETFRLKGTVQDSFTACDQTCHSGCYHGAMERFLRGNAASDDEAGHISEEELRSRAVTACDPTSPTRFRFQCLHGLGHALMFFLDYQLEKALAACGTLPGSWDQSSCYGGLFMENVFSATPEKRDLSPSDYHYPCNKLDPQYRVDCYMMQTTRMSEMGLSTERLFEECRTAGPYRYTCMQSIGRDLSNDARVGDPRRVAEKCELGIGLPAQVSPGEILAGEDRRACTRGVAYALIDNTWDGRYAFPFCAAFRAEEDTSYCFSITGSYLKATYAKSAAQIAGDCRSYAPRSEFCPPATGD